MLTVEDTGVGIPQEELPRVFERFHRLEGDATPGSGLGLSIAKAIVERHRGTIVLEDANAALDPPGLAVRITLPACYPSAGRESRSRIPAIADSRTLSVT